MRSLQTSQIDDSDSSTSLIRRRHQNAMKLPIVLFSVWFSTILGEATRPNQKGQQQQNADGNHEKQKRKNRDGRPNFILLFMDDLGYGDMGFTGHPTTRTPNLDQLAYNGKILTTWYSGCSVCSGSRAALMTGRQFPRFGLPGVLGAAGNTGLPLNETTIAEQLKKAGYSTGIVGKWHLGQRQVYLPANRGFDYYLGIPYSDDMGAGVQSECPAELDGKQQYQTKKFTQEFPDNPFAPNEQMYQQGGFLNSRTNNEASIHDIKPAHPDPAANVLPLVYQNRKKNETKVLEQPLDFTTLADKYNDFVLNFLEDHQEDPFFLYLPFSHVHTTRSTSEEQYAGCKFQGSTERGSFGDALEESDWIVGNMMTKLEELGLDEDTLILFTSDNGPWLIKDLSGGSAGLFTGRFAGYWNTGKATTWEGGIRMPAFAYWKGKIRPFSRSSEIVSSMDVFPTLSSLAGVSLPPNRTMDGRDMSDILLQEHSKSQHDFLFLYGNCGKGPYWEVSGVRHGDYKAHWCTMPGLQDNRTAMIHRYDPPLLFNVAKDPSEASPISYNKIPEDPKDAAAMNRILKAYAMEKATFEFGNLVPYPDGPGEGPGTYGVCCDRKRECYCRDSMANHNVGIFGLGTAEHHDKYHDALGEEEPSPPVTATQAMLHEWKAQNQRNKLRSTAY